MRKKIVIIQRALKFYQIKFFEKLKEKCSQNNIELVLIYGQDDSLTFNDADIRWGIKVKNYRMTLFSKKLCYQNVWKYVKDADLIIVEQANKYIINYFLWLLNILKIKKLAFWGHGINFQNDKSLISNISEFFKKKFTKRIHWFFAYTELTKEIVIKTGLSLEKITVVNNTIAVEDLKNEITKYDDDKLSKVREKIGLKGNNVCLYVGGMYKEKRLDFLISSLTLIKQSVADFEIIFIGDGPQKEIIVNFVKDKDWAYYLGVKDEISKVPYFLISKLFLMPGLVGLAIIDTFVFGVPLITTDCKLHSPEISYLENGVNGIMTKDDVEEYAKNVIYLLNNEKEREKLKQGCKISAEKYTLENFVNRFYEGIFRSLNYYS